MPTSLIVVDDFFDHIDELRRTALRMTYPDLQGAFPGRNSLERVNIPGIVEQVSRLTGEHLKVMDPLGSHAKCRITRAADVGKAKVHIDPSYWSGILYLSKPEHCQGGTDMFRHIPTNTDRAPLNDSELAAMGYATMSEMHRDIIERDSTDDSKWERTMRVPMRYNRLMLLRPWLWHTAGEGFGDDLENGRLVYLMFFTRA